MHSQLPSMAISLSLKGVPNRVTCPQVQVFSPHEKLQGLTGKVYIFMQYKV